jgi:hypothetical protein
MKVCIRSDCSFSGKEQTLEQFHRDKTKRDGRVGTCKTCVAQRDATRYAADPQKYISYQRDYQKKNTSKVRDRQRRYRQDHPEKILLIQARRRAKEKNIAFSISEADIMIPEICPLLGIKLSPVSGQHGGGDSSPSLDRKRPELGYIPGNVWVISWKANRIKCDASLEELQRLTEGLRQVLAVQVKTR